jgi:hypothetical protein
MAVLDQLGILYLIGGSLASGSYGLPRQTNDIDIVADFRNVDIAVFCAGLRDDFYLDPKTVAECLARGRPFNLIHLQSGFKFDFFPASPDGFSQSELSRRRYVVSGLPGLENMKLPVCSPEDSVLSKLVWFRKGGEVSDRQWHDILGVLRIQAPLLDRAYLDKWAHRLGVSALLVKADMESKAR